MDPHPATGVSRPLALQLRPSCRRLHDRVDLVNDRLAEDNGEREDGPAREHEAGDSREVAGSPEAYQRYIQRSRGEFSCAKASCLEFQNAWISDRTLCYLASGKPAVVQHTGASSILPHGEGMFRFSSVDDAARALEEINLDYERHCHAARGIAETHFDSQRVLEGVLNAALSR